MRVGLRYWMRALLRRERFETDLDEELRYHLAREIERLRAGGMPLDEAKRTARLGFGNVAVLKEESRDARGTRFIEELVADIEYALRLLRRSPGFAAVAILTLAMGIGLTTAIVSVVSAVFVRPLVSRERSARHGAAVAADRRSFHVRDGHARRLPRVARAERDVFSSQRLHGQLVRPDRRG